MFENDFDYDLLLEYLSYKKHGLWKDFKKYVQNLSYDLDEFSKENLNIRIYSIRRSLSALGHVEFVFGDKSFYSVAPPAIALFKNSYEGVLCGYRTVEFMTKLADLCERFGIGWVKEDNYNSPKTVFINFQNEDILNKFKEHNDLNIGISNNFSQKLIESVPDMNSVIASLDTCAYFNNDEGNVQIFDSMGGHEYNFVPVKGKKTIEWSVFRRNNLNRQSEYFLYKDDKYYKVDRDYSLCKYFSEYYNRVLYYKNGVLKFKYLKYIPELIDRALTLSSGKNRKTINNCICYDNIDLDIAKLVSYKTGLELTGVYD